MTTIWIHLANIGKSDDERVRTKMNSLFEVQLRLMAQDAANEAIKIVARHLLRLLWPLVRAGCFACRMVPSNLDAIAGRLTACSLARRVEWPRSLRWWFVVLKCLKMLKVCQAIASHRCRIWKTVSWCFMYVFAEDQLRKCFALLVTSFRRQGRLAAQFRVLS